MTYFSIQILIEIVLFYSILLMNQCKVQSWTYGFHIWKKESQISVARKTMKTGRKHTKVAIGLSRWTYTFVNPQCLTTLATYSFDRKQSTQTIHRNDTFAYSCNTIILNINYFYKTF
jgi:hypothetical protein